MRNRNRHKTPNSLDPKEKALWQQIRADLAAQRRTRADEDRAPGKFPDVWLVDSEWLLNELARIRDLALRVPITPANFQPSNSVVDALWQLETLLRGLLKLQREMQNSFAAKAEQTRPPFPPAARGGKQKHGAGEVNAG